MPRVPAVPRWLRIALVAFVGLYALYLIAANVVLRTQLLRSWVSRDPSATELRYASAWTVVPGEVHVKDFSLRFQDENVQFLLGIDDATVDVDLPALTRRTFRATHTDARGVSFAMRYKLKSAKGQEARLAAYAPIPGFEGTLVRDPKPPEPADTSRLWTIEMRDVTASIRELWVLEYRYRGAGSAAGSFRLAPTQEFGLAPSALLLDHGKLSLGDAPVLEDVVAKVETRVDDFYVQNPAGLEILRQIDARLDLTGDVVSVDPFSTAYLSPSREIRFTHGHGAVAFHAHMDHGLLVDRETRLDYRTPDVGVAAPFGSFRGDLHLTSKIQGERENGVLVSDAASGHLTFTAENAKQVAVTAEDVNVGLAFDHADVSRPLATSSLVGRVGQARAADLSALQGLLPPAIQLAGGASLAAKFGYHGGAFDGRADIALDRASVRSNDIEIATSGKVWCTAKSADTSRLVTFPELGARLESLAFQHGGRAVSDLWASIAFSGAALRGSNLETRATLHAGPGDRILRFAAELAGVPKEAADVASGRQLDATLRLTKSKNDEQLVLEEAHDGKLESKGRIAKAAEGKPRGAFLLVIDPITLGILVDGKNTSVRPLVGRDWLEQQN